MMIKKFQLFIIFILFSGLNVLAQQQSVCFYILDSQSKPVSCKFEIKNVKTKKITKLRSNAQGKAYAWIPSYQEIDFSFESESKFARFKIYPQVDNVITIYKHSVELTQSANIHFGTLYLTVQNSDKKRMVNEDVLLINKLTKQRYQAKTNAEGKAEIQLPIGNIYELQYHNAPDYEEVAMPDKLQAKVELLSVYEGSAAKMLHPSRKKCLFTMSYKDLENNPLENELFIVKSSKTGQQYKVITNKDGVAQLLAPIGDVYSVSTSYLNNYAIPTVPDTAGLYEMIVEVNYLSTNSIRKERSKRAAELARRDSLVQKSKTLQNSIERPAAMLKADIQKRTKAVMDSLNRDKNILQKNNHIPAAIFQRMGNVWQRKVVVTDLTCSMDKYSEDILLWHNLQLNKKEQNDYLFFNDGDGKTDTQKKDGYTGGIHHVKSQNMDSIIACMQLTRRLSPNCSGDGPENDLEAVLAGIKYLDKGATLVLIADNISDVRDMSLLPLIKVPVHIILCGVSETINEDYLEIAHKTKGSIHLINEDVTTIATMIDGQTILIKGKRYKLIHGKFVRAVKQNEINS